MKRSIRLGVTLTVLWGLIGGFSSPGQAAPARRVVPKASATPRSRATPTPTPKPSKSASKDSSRAAKARPTPTPPPSKPDRSLYQIAEKIEDTLRSSSRLKAKRTEWEKAAAAYKTVVDRYPRSPYCDDALLKAGELQREMADLFSNRKYADQALASFAMIVDEYPGSSRGEPALFATYEILTARGQTTQARAAAEKYLAAYPEGKRAKELKKALSASRAASRPKETPPPSSSLAGGSAVERSASVSGGQVQIFGVRFWSGESSTRVVIDLDRKVEIQQDRLASPPRLFVDLLGTRLHPNLVGKAFPVGNAFLKQIRIGSNRENVVRVVIDFEEASSHTVFFLANPERLVIDIRGEPPKGLRTASAPSPSPRETIETVQVTQPLPFVPQPSPTATPAVEDPVTSPTPLPTPAPSPIDVRSAPTPLPTPVPTPSHRSTPRPEPLATPAPTPPPQASPTPRPAPVNASAPTRNRDGSYSLARQLGLGARRICLDAGHGGHDPGAIGRRGTQEKDITLAVVLKLEKLIRTELGADVVMTRDTDVFIPLEERTAIANASGADLFLSVHINSARNSSGRGIETYYLSFAKNAAAEELAARENAISQATMKDLNKLVKAITTNSKIDESRDFAGIIQRSHIQTLSPGFDGVLDRGVHTAPFYVLIGANMPSILTEVGFISNPEEEKWLKSEEYQEKLAESLLEGVRAYLGQLNRNQATRLEGRSGARVSAKGAGRR
jgi:N-acetylmuramoyl-L-alanine amidase